MTGGQTPGTAQLAATTSTRGEPHEASRRGALAREGVDDGDDQGGRPVVHGEPRRHDVPPGLLGHGLGGQRHRADLPADLLGRGPRDGLGELRHEGVEVDGRGQLRGLPGGVDLTGEHLGGLHPGGQPGADDRAGGGADDEVGVVEADPLLGQPGEQAGAPGDARDPAAPEDHRALARHADDPLTRPTRAAR